MVYSELPTLSSLSSRAWARQEPLSHLSRWNLSSYDSSISLPLSPLSALFSCGPGRDRVRVGLPGLITLITLPVKVDHREKREERMGERRAECEQRSAVRECGPAPGAASCDLAAIIWVTHSHTGRGLTLGSRLSSGHSPVAAGSGQCLGHTCGHCRARAAGDMSRE